MIIVVAASRDASAHDDTLSEQWRQQQHSRGLDMPMAEYRCRPPELGDVKIEEDECETLAECIPDYDESRCLDGEVCKFASACMVKLPEGFYPPPPDELCRMRIGEWSVEHPDKPRWGCLRDGCPDVGYRCVAWTNNNLVVCCSETPLGGVEEKDGGDPPDDPLPMAARWRQSDQKKGAGGKEETNIMRKKKKRKKERNYEKKRRERAAQQRKRERLKLQRISERKRARREERIRNRVERGIGDPIRVLRSGGVRR